jgi:hypothetical protein
LFCFELFSWLICFFFLISPQLFFSFNFCVKFDHVSFSCYF